MKAHSVCSLLAALFLLALCPLSGYSQRTAGTGQLCLSYGRHLRRGKYLSGTNRAFRHGST